MTDFETPCEDAVCDGTRKVGDHRSGTERSCPGCHDCDPLLGVPFEPPRPYSHGRRFIPAWLAAERACAMALDPYSPGAAWYASVDRLPGYISPSDTTVIHCPIPRPA